MAVIETFGSLNGEKIPPDEDIQKSFDDPSCTVYQIVHEGRQVGGAIVKIDTKTHHNSLELFFIPPDQHSRGFGLAAWQAIEKMYPETQVWETATPYFEKRNIHFYVNKCGFKIVKFYNQSFRDPHEKKNPDGSAPDFDCFIVEKDMRG